MQRLSGSRAAHLRWQEIPMVHKPLTSVVFIQHRGMRSRKPFGAHVQLKNIKSTVPIKFAGRFFIHWELRIKTIFTRFCLPASRRPFVEMWRVEPIYLNGWGPRQSLPACLVVSSRRSGCRFKACGNMAIRLTVIVTTAPRKGPELAQLYKAPRTKRRVVMAGVDRWRERCVMVDSRSSLPAALLRSL
jgi:hypothetical protein